MDNVYEIRTQIDEDIIKVYEYGSIVYGCSTNKSDADYIVVVDSDEEFSYSVREEEADYTVYSTPAFIRRIQDHHISALECIFQSKDDPFRKYFKYDSEKLRRVVSAISSNSFGKCKKKLIDGEDYIGRKSIFHSIRILMFGIQIARHHEIINYAEANHHLKSSMELEGWEELKSHFMPIYNTLKSEFKILAPLDGDK